MKHTPGPWEAVIYEGSYDQPLITSNNGTIARLHSFDERQHELNAKLISKAPDMYKQLQNVIDYNDSIREDFQISSSLIRQINNLLKEIEE